MRMADWLNWLNDITGIAGFAFAIWAYLRERATRKRLETAEAELEKQLNYIKAVDAAAEKANFYREKVWR
jgi:hypothetical protein